MALTPADREYLQGILDESCRALEGVTAECLATEGVMVGHCFHSGCPAIRNSPQPILTMKCEHFLATLFRYAGQPGSEMTRYCFNHGDDNGIAELFVCLCV